MRHEMFFWDIIQIAIGEGKSLLQCEEKKDLGGQPGYLTLGLTSETSFPLGSEQVWFDLPVFGANGSPIGRTQRG